MAQPWWWGPRARSGGFLLPLSRLGALSTMLRMVPLPRGGGASAASTPAAWAFPQGQERVFAPGTPYPP